MQAENSPKSARKLGNAAVCISIANVIVAGLLLFLMVPLFIFVGVSPM